jgi:pantothenate synthetase
MCMPIWSGKLIVAQLTKLLDIKSLDIAWGQDGLISLSHNRYQPLDERHASVRLDQRITFSASRGREGLESRGEHVHGACEFLQTERPCDTLEFVSPHFLLSVVGKVL